MKERNPIILIGIVLLVALIYIGPSNFLGALTEPNNSFGGLNLITGVLH